MKKFIVSQRVYWGLRIPSGKDCIKIGKFSLAPDFPENPQVSHIYLEVEANTKEEADIIGLREIRTFLDKWNFLDNSKPQILGESSVQDVDTKITTHTRTISARAFIAKNISKELIEEFNSTFPPDKEVDSEPIGCYRQALIKEDLFERYKEFYKVLEFYLPTTGSVTSWIQSVKADVQMVRGERRPITIFSSIRHRLSHPTKLSGQQSLSANDPEGVRLVKDHLLEIQELAKKIIKEHLEN